MKRILRKVLRVVADRDPDYYDMYADANERFFAQLYVRPIMRHAAALGIVPPASLLEAGCQAGRLVVPFAKLGFRVTGIDTSAFALRRAREHAKAEGVQATFVRGDVLEVLRDHPQQRYDLIVCAEVVYLSPRYREILQAFARAVRPGGLLCVSHRTTFYYLLEAIRQYDVATACEVLKRSEGPLGDSAYYNWQTEEELRTLYHSLGLRLVAMHPIDRLAWLGGVSPGQLDSAKREQWLDLELQWSGSAATCARYVLVVAGHPGEETACASR